MPSAAALSSSSSICEGERGRKDVTVSVLLPRGASAVSSATLDSRYRKGPAPGSVPAAVADVGRNGFLHVDDVVVADAIQFAGGDAGLHMRLDYAQHFGREATGNAHLLDVFGGFDGDGHAAIIAQPTPARPPHRLE